MQLTDARRRALAVLVDADRQGRQARESNVTSLAIHTVYWQTVTWLLQHHLVTKSAGAYGAELTLTQRGRELAAGIEASDG